MKKRIFSLLFAIVMLFGILPSMIFADEATHKVTFVVTKTNNSTVDLWSTSYSVKSSDGTVYKPVEDQYGWEQNYFYLPDGNYTYSFTYSKSEQKSGEFTVDGEDIEINVQLETIYYPITFDVEPEGVEYNLTLWKNGWQGAYGDPIEPDENGVYSIPFGQYRYIIEADGYTSANATFNATDTSVINNGYAVKVKLKSEHEKILSDAVRELLRISGEEIVLNEFTGNLYEFGDEFTPWDIDSDYDDTNVIDYVKEVLNKKSDKFSKIDISIENVEKDYWYYDDCDDESDYSVIAEDGTINYSAVNNDNYSYEADGAVYTVYFNLSYGGYEETEYLTFIVPKHIFTRGERINEAADYAINNILGENEDINKVTSNLNLIRLFEDDEYGWYYINSEWESSNPEIISNNGEVTRPRRDTNVTIKLTAFYMPSWYVETGFLMDPGPIEEASREISVTVSGTKNTQFYAVTVANSYAENSGEGLYESEDIVEISAGVRNGYVFAGWSSDADVVINDAENINASFIMPEHSVVVRANWMRKTSNIPSIFDFYRYAWSNASYYNRNDDNTSVKDDEVQGDDKVEDQVTDTANKDNEWINDFTDVSSDDWFYDDVKFVCERGIMNGVSGEAFKPYTPTTRAMIVTILWRLEGMPSAEYAITFDDVDTESYYAEAVRWGASVGIVNGYSDSEFAPNDKITREQLAAFIYRYAQYKELIVGNDLSSDKMIFADTDNISEWALPGMEWCVSNYMMNGISEFEIAPKGEAVRSQVAAILHRFCCRFLGY